MTSIPFFNAISLQSEIAKKVISRNLFPSKIKYVSGIDVAYKNNIAFCSAVTLEKDTLKPIELVDKTLKVKYPYIPGFFMFRESGPIISTLKLLKHRFDILLIDGHGRLHPRRCGLACFVGVNINKPVIGVAKRLLCGTEKKDRVIIDNKILGSVIKKGKKKTYVSVGHKISLKTASKLVKELIRDDHWYPEPLRVAHINSKRIKHRDT